MLDLTKEIQKAFNGDAWHGNHVMQILNNVKPETAFEYFVPNGHSIAEIALHLTAWTEEVTSRLSGNAAVEPVKGDWPTPEEKTAVHWEKIIFDFKIANEELIRLVGSKNSNQWDDAVADARDPALGNGVTYAELLNGLIQHHAYHAGQIAILSKF